MKIFNQGGQTASMVVMSMRQHHHVHRANGPLPKIRRDYILTDIDFGLGVCSVSQESTAIHQHQFSIRKRHQQAVALAYIDGGQLEFSTPYLRWKGMPI